MGGGQMPGGGRRGIRGRDWKKGAEGSSSSSLIFETTFPHIHKIKIMFLNAVLKQK